MRTTLLIFLMACFTNCFAQTETTFTVSKQKKIEIKDNYDTMQKSISSEKKPVSIQLWDFPFQDGDSVSKNVASQGIRLTVVQPSGNSSFLMDRVLSFKMDVTCNGKTETFNSPNEYRTVLMRNKLSTLQEGCMVVFKDIKYTSTNSSPDDLYAGPYRIFITQ